MAEWRGITYYEASPSSPTETWAVDSSRTVRTLLFFGSDPAAGVSLDERHAIAEAFLGYAERKAVGGKVYLARTTPHFYPSRNGFTYLYCQAILHSEIAGLPFPAESPFFAAAGDKTAVRPCWKVTFQYAVNPWRVKEDNEVLARSGSPLFVSDAERYPDEGDQLARGLRYTRYIRRSIEPGGRCIPIRQGMLKYEDVVDAAGNRIGTAEPFPFNEVYDYYNYTWYGVPEEAIPWTAIHTLANKINDDKFDGAFLDTLLFLGVRIVQRHDALGQYTVDLAYRFMWCPRPDGTTITGHNGIPRIVKDVGVVYTRVSSDGTVDLAKRPYRRGSFPALFRPE